MCCIQTNVGFDRILNLLATLFHAMHYRKHPTLEHQRTPAGDKVLATTLAVLPGGSGAPASALQALERAAAAAATPLAYQPEELLQLIAEHLRASGLSASAETLAGMHSNLHIVLYFCAF